MNQIIFAAGIYDFTREVAHFCTLGLYITKNKYKLTLPSEFCRFPVKIMAAYEALKKKIVVVRTGPTASKRHAGQRAHSQCQGLVTPSSFRSLNDCSIIMYVMAERFKEFSPGSSVWFVSHLVLICVNRL